MFDVGDRGWRSGAQLALTRTPPWTVARALSSSDRSTPPMKCIKSVSVPSIWMPATAYGAVGPPSNPWYTMVAARITPTGSTSIHSSIAAKQVSQ